MTTSENPPGFVVRTEAQKAAFDNGFRIERGFENGWMRYASATARGEIWIAGASFVGPWLLSVSHPGVAAELGHIAPDIEGPGLAQFVLSSLAELYTAVARAYRLGVSLPKAPLSSSAGPSTIFLERPRLSVSSFSGLAKASSGTRC